MRLTRPQRETLVSCIHQFAGEDINVRVFGSRLDDARRDGDLDLLLVSSSPISLLTRAELKQALEARLKLPVYIVTYTHGDEPTPFQAIAIKHSRPVHVAEILVFFEKQGVIDATMRGAFGHRFTLREAP